MCRIIHIIITQYALCGQSEAQFTQTLFFGTTNCVGDGVTMWEKRILRIIRINSKGPLQAALFTSRANLWVRFAGLFAEDGAPNHCELPFEVYPICERILPRFDGYPLNLVARHHRGKVTNIFNISAILCEKCIRVEISLPRLGCETLLTRGQTMFLGSQPFAGRSNRVNMDSS
jgi:hypothetical protein